MGVSSGQLQAVLQRFSVDLVIDVGANEGQFAQSLRRFYRGKIQSFEPASAVFEKLSMAAVSDPNWHLQNVAMGSENARRTIHLADQTVFSSLLTSNDHTASRFGAGSVGKKDETVTVQRVDEVLDEVAAVVSGKRIFLEARHPGL